MPVRKDDFFMDAAAVRSLARMILERTGKQLLADTEFHVWMARRLFEKTSFAVGMETLEDLIAVKGIGRFVCSVAFCLLGH